MKCSLPLRLSWCVFLPCLLSVSGFHVLAAEASNTTISLFNGRDLSGWAVESGGQFTVEEGRLVVNRGTGWLRSDATFGDFTLTMEFRFLEARANSGIFVRTGSTSHDDANGWPDNGYQIQCWDTIDGAAPLGAMIPYGAPEFEHHFDREALARAYRPTGEWQTFVITCEGEDMTISLNDAVITTCTSIKNLTGHIGIQGEKGLLEFRRIEVQPH